MADKPQQLLRKARKAKGFRSAKEAAQYFNWSISTYTAHENGSRGIRAQYAQLYAAAFDIDVNLLLGLPPTAKVTGENEGLIEFVGMAEVGVWRDEIAKPWADDEVHPDFEGRRFALLVCDDSIDRHIKRGEWAIYEPMKPAKLAFDKLVVVEQRSGDLRELSVQRVTAVSEGAYFITHDSTRPKYDGVAPIKFDPLRDDNTFQVLGVVVGVYRSI